MNESLQEIAGSVNTDCTKYQPARANVTRCLRSNERIPTVNACRSASRRGQRAPQAGQGFIKHRSKRSESVHSSLADGIDDGRFRPRVKSELIQTVSSG